MHSACKRMADGSAFSDAGGPVAPIDPTPVFLGCGGNRFLLPCPGPARYRPPRWRAPPLNCRPGRFRSFYPPGSSEQICSGVVFHWVESGKGGVSRARREAASPHPYFPPETDRSAAPAVLLPRPWPGFAPLRVRDRVSLGRADGSCDRYRSACVNPPRYSAGWC